MRLGHRGMGRASTDQVRERTEGGTGRWRVGCAIELVWSSSRYWMLLSIAIMAVQSILPLISLYLLKLIVDDVSAAASHGGKAPHMATLGLLIACGCLVALVTALCSAAARVVDEIQSHCVTDHLLNRIHAQAVSVDFGCFDDASFYDRLHRAQREADYRATHVVSGLVRVTQNATSLLAVGVLLCRLQWVFPLLLVAFALPGALVRARDSKHLYHWARSSIATQRKAAYFSWLLTNEQYAKEIRLFGLGGVFSARFRELRNRLRRERLVLVAKHVRGEVITDGAAAIVVYGALALVAYRAASGAATLGDLVMYFQAFQRGQAYLVEALKGMAGLYEDNLFLTSLTEFFELRPHVTAPSEPRCVPSLVSDGVHFEGVSFCYHNSRHPALNDISLTIRSGETVALVGENGSGKTTLVKLLCRLYDPSDGRITIDGVDIREFDPAALRGMMAVTPQDYGKYHLTATESIWLGDVRAPVDGDQVVLAARRSGADALVSRLASGYDTVLGRSFDEGVDLSGGEWQKIALARSFYRDVPLVVLDEPTAALDAQSEYELFNNFRDFMKGRMGVIISHRFSTVKMAHHIYVLERGRITEHGNHTELMGLGGTYARLFQMQSQFYE